MNNIILFANEYNSGYGNVLPLVKAAYDPDIQALGKIRLALSSNLPEVWGVEYDKLDTPKVDVERDPLCYEDTLMNTVVGLSLEELTDCVIQRMDYLEKQGITHVVLRDSPAMAIAAYALGLPRIFYQESISIPPSNKWKRKLIKANVNQGANEYLLKNINSLFENTLSLEPILDISQVFKSDHNLCSDYPIFDRYKNVNIAVSRSDVQYVGLLSEGMYDTKPKKGKTRAVIYLDESLEVIQDVINQIKSAPYDCDIMVFNTPNTKIEPWEDDKITFIGDAYQPIEPCLVGASILVCNGGTSLLKKSVSCACLPVLFNPIKTALIQKLEELGAVVIATTAMDIAHHYSRSSMSKYRETLVPLSLVEFQTISDPVGAIVASIKELT